jgi:hypothetical protein
MNYKPCQQRTFPIRVNTVKYYETHLRWLRHLSERLGVQNTLSIWQETCAGRDDTFLMQILTSGWREIPSDEADLVENRIHELIAEIFSTSTLGLSAAEVRRRIENTPPIAQIKQLYSSQTMERNGTAYEALHLRFDAQAGLAETLMKNFGKQGELIVYDLLVDERLASAKGQTASIEEFIENQTALPDTSSLFTAGLEIEMISQSKSEVAFNVRQCEWARYFQDHHPKVGYLMACSTDEVGYKAFNPHLRLQRTQTIMEGGKMCDFRIYAIGK